MQDKPEIFKSPDQSNNRGTVENIASLSRAEKLLNAIADRALEKKEKKLTDEFNTKFENTALHEHSEEVKNNILAKKIQNIRKTFNDKPDIIPYESRLLELEARSLKKTGDDTNVNAIIKPQPMAEKIEPQKVGNSESKKISPEDMKLIEFAHNQAGTWKKILSRKYGDEIKDKRNERDLAEFNQSPYAWMVGAWNRTISNGRRDLKLKTISKAQQQIIEKNIKDAEEKLGNLKQAFEKNLPLNLDRNFTKKEIVLSGGKTFNVDKYSTAINKLTKSNNTNYEIVNVVQRKYGDFIVLRTKDGEVELDISKAERIIKDTEREEKINAEKENKFKQIAPGKIVGIRVGGRKGRESTYRIRIIEDGRIFFDAIKNNIGGHMTLPQLRDFLFSPNTEFIVEEDKSKRKNEKKKLNDPVPLPPKKSEDAIEPALAKIEETVNESAASDQGEDNTPAQQEVKEEELSTTEKDKAMFIKMLETIKANNERSTQLDIEIAELRELEQKQNDYKELVRLTRYRIANPKEPTTKEIENLFKKYKELADKIYNIEIHRANAISEVKSSEGRNKGKIGTIYYSDIPDPETGSPVPLRASSKEEMFAEVDRMYNEALDKIGVKDYI